MPSKLVTICYNALGDSRTREAHVGSFSDSSPDGLNPPPTPLSSAVSRTTTPDHLCYPAYSSLLYRLAKAPLQRSGFELSAKPLPSNPSSPCSLRSLATVVSAGPGAFSASAWPNAVFNQHRPPKLLREARLRLHATGSMKCSLQRPA